MVDIRDLYHDSDFINLAYGSVILVFARRVLGQAIGEDRTGVTQGKQGRRAAYHRARSGGEAVPGTGFSHKMTIQNMVPNDWTICPVCLKEAVTA